MTQKKAAEGNNGVEYAKKGFRGIRREACFRVIRREALTRKGLFDIISIQMALPANG